MKTYQYLWRLITYRPWLYLANIFLWAAVWASPMLPGLITRMFFDTLTGARPATLSLWAVIALLVAAAAGRIMVIGIGIFASVTNRNYVEGLLRRNLLARVLQMPGAAALPDSPGESLNVFRDDVQQAEDTTDFLLDTVGQIISIVITLTVLIRINARMTTLVFLPLVVVVAMVRMAGNRLQQFRRASREATSRVTGLIAEMFGAVQAIQVAGAEDRFIGHFRRLSDRRKQTMVRDRFLGQLIESVSGNTASLGTGLVLLLSARAMQAGQFTVGDFALFVYYLSFVSDFTQMMGRWLALYKQTGVSFERMERLMQGAPVGAVVQHAPIYLKGEIPAATEPDRHDADRLEELNATGLTYRYPETGRGIAGINLWLRRGSFTVITGRVGAGKTTLLRTLLGLLPAQAGEIRWNGRPVADPATHFVPPRCAATSQIPLLFSDTLQNNILMGLREERADIPGAIRSAVMERDLDAMEDGLETVVGSRGVRLSGGQIQRAAAARMFVRQPELMVFDDLSSALDVETEATLWERVFEREGATCLVVSHRPDALRRADRIIVLKDGHVEDEGRLEELLERCEEMQRLWQTEPSQVS